MSVQPIGHSIPSGFTLGPDKEFLRRGGAAARQFIARYGVLLGFLAFWQIASRQGWINPAVFPPLDTIIGALWNGLAGGSLLDDIAISLQRAGAALASASNSNGLHMSAVTGSTFSCGKSTRNSAASRSIISPQISTGT